MMKTYPLIRQLLPPVLAILVFTALYGVLFQWDNKYTAAVPGGYGYCGMDTYQGKIGFLVEGWEFYPGELLTPQDFQAGKRPEQYTYVGQYPNYSQVSDSAYGVATYRLVLEHTPPGQALFLPELLCAGRVYINGMMVGEQGSISPYQPQVMDELYAIPGEGTVEVVVQCANYTHYDSGMYYPPAVGSLVGVARMAVIRLAVYGLLCFVAAAVAISCLVQWLLGRDKLLGWMGLMSLCYALSVCDPFLRAVGVPSIRPLYAMEDVCGSMVLLCAMVLAGEWAGRASHVFHKRVALPMAAGLCAACLIFPVFLQKFYQDNRPDVQLFGVKFVLQQCTEALVVEGSPERLRMALENLCCNALSFTPERGKITLSLRREGSAACIEVRDTGVGIDGEQLSHVFERGYTQRPDGTGEGRGLHLVRSIAVEHGGAVYASSQPGKGSTFILRLPLAEKI